MARFITVHDQGSPAIELKLNVDTIAGYLDSGGVTPNGHTSAFMVWGGQLTFDESPSDITDLINALDDI